MLHEEQGLKWRDCLFVTDRSMSDGTSEQDGDLVDNSRKRRVSARSEARMRRLKGDIDCESPRGTFPTRSGSRRHRVPHKSGMLACVATRQHRKEALAPRQLARVLQWINDHLDQKITVYDLAKAAHLSAAHFARAFRHSAGTTPHRCVLQRRMAKAKRLLRDTNLTVEAVALHTGYSHRVPFTNAFRRLTGFSPSKWRIACPQCCCSVDNK